MTSQDKNNIAAPLYGLVLAGGKSVRMGHDKGTLLWHGIQQRYYMADMLQGLCEKTYISCRSEQVAEIDSDYHTLPDAFTGSGPLGAILTAFESHPHVAWLIIACDLPLLDNATLDFLVANRNASLIATTFQSPFDQLPEPLITIWEPAALAVLRSFQSSGFTCPRKVLIRSSEQVKIIVPPHADALMNANTPEDAETVKMIIAGQNI